MVNLLSIVGGSRNPCGRCDLCKGGCSFTSNLIKRRNESDEYSELRAKFLKLKEILEEMCLVCKSKNCDGTVCLDKGCYKCGRTGDRVRVRVALVCLNGRHVHVMQRWDDHSKIRKIIVDEPKAMHALRTFEWSRSFLSVPLSVVPDLLSSF